MAKRSTKGRNIPGLITQIGREQGLSPAQIRAMIATSKVESGWDPNQIGDGGTSFGLYQHHIGGAGGSTRDSADDYLNPVKSISERAKWFKKNNITDGEGAYRLQRPANHGDYVSKVNAALGSIGNVAPTTGALPSAGAVSPSAGLGGAAPSAPTQHIGAWGQSFLADYLYGDDPVMRSVIANTFADDPVAAPEVTAELPDGGGRQVSPTPSGKAGTYHGGKLKNYNDLLQLAHSMGLKNDAGNGQTTGGNHVADSKHYRSKAVDFGDGKNSRDALTKFATYLKQNAKALGIDEVAYNPMGWGMDQGHYIKGMRWDNHDDHLHVGLLG
jgi:hypothetical protein